MIIYKTSSSKSSGEGEYSNDFKSLISKNILDENKKLDERKSITISCQKEEDEILLGPILEDLLYASSFDFNSIHDINFLMSNIGAIKYVIFSSSMYLGDFGKLFDGLYPSYTEGINLIDYLIEYYMEIPTNTIEEKYLYLKMQKQRMLSMILAEINKRFHTSYDFRELIDEKVLVVSYSNIHKLREKDLDNLVLIDKNGYLYQYSKEHNGYYSEEAKDFISKNEVKIKQKVLSFDKYALKKLGSKA